MPPKKKMAEKAAFGGYIYCNLLRVSCRKQGGEDSFGKNAKVNKASKKQFSANFFSLISKTK